MIYCNLKGGLGNMMFQIAATISFSIEKGIDFSFPNLDRQLTYLNDDNYYNPTLKHTFEYKEIFKGFKCIQPNVVIPVYNFPFYFVESNIETDNFFIDGFFQNEKYFVKHRNEILKAFEIPKTIEFIIKEKYGVLLDKRLTSIHVRRGDYVRLPDHHPVQTIDYYLDSAKILSDKTDLYVIFSDDIEWCKENFKNITNIVYIENEKDYIELFLMSLCDNNIISNSSFSWWGAWLNTNKNKIVIGPNKWFGKAIKNNSGDILPETWFKR
jgi:hypothetical protein